MIKAFFVNWVGAFRDGLRVMAALPLVVALQVAVEFAQHLIELHVGFFSADPATHQAATMAPLRIALGWPKMIMVYVVMFFAIRFLLSGDRRWAMRPDAAALKRFAGVLAFYLIAFALMLYAQPIMALFGFPQADPRGMRAVVGLGQRLVEPLLLFWFASAAMGDRTYGPASSARAIGWWYFWALPLTFATQFVIGLLHLMLNRWPVGFALPVQIAMLALDAVVVGFMVSAVPAAQVRAVRYVAGRRGKAVPGRPA